MDLKERLALDFEVVQQGLNGSANSAVNQRRKDAFATFSSAGFPTTKQEEWKYTSLQQISERDLQRSSSTSISEEELSQFLVPEMVGSRLVMVNGNYVPELSERMEEDGAYIGPFADMPDEVKAVYELHFGKYATNSASLNALSTAFAMDGIMVYLPKGTIIYKHPIHILHITDNRDGQYISQPRVLVVAEESSQLSLIESYHNLGEGGFSNAVTEVYAGTHSYIDYTKYQVQCSHLEHVGTTEVYQEADSHFSGTTITWSGKLIRNNINTTHGGENCDTHYYGLYALGDNMHVDNHTLVDHAKPNCTSTELYKGLIDNDSTAVFNGKIIVEEDAQKTSAFQSNKNILLSGKGVVNAKPELEIYADDVKCSHGATTGQLNRDEVFYLQSRGVSEKKAKGLLLLAFARDVLEKVRIIPLNKHLNDLFERTLQARIDK